MKNDELERKMGKENHSGDKNSPVSTTTVEICKSKEIDFTGALPVSVEVSPVVRK